MKKNREIVLFWGFIVVLCVMYVWICSKKQDFHTDEYFTYEIANSSRMDMSLPYDTWFASDYVIDEMTVDKDARFVFGKIIEKEKTDLHPFLYPAIIHGICSFFPERFSMWYGLGFNIFCAVGATAVIYLTIKRLTNSFVFAIGSAIAFSMSAGVTKQVAFTRMYVMMMLLLSLILYLYCRYWDEPQSISFRYGILTVSVIGALTHYYFLVFLVLCFIVYFVRLLIKKEYNCAKMLLLTEVCAAVISIVVFPYMLPQMMRMLGNDSLSPDTSVNAMTYWQKIKVFFDIIDKNIFGRMLVPLIVFIFAFCILLILINKARKRIDGRLDITIVMLFPVIGYFLLAAKTSPYMTDRYVAPLYPILIVMVFYLLFVFMKSIPFVKQKSWILLVTTICLVFVGNSYANNVNEYLYEDRREILEAVEYRKDRDLVYLIPQYTEWIVPSSTSELKDYDDIMLMQYSSIDNAQIMDMLPKELPFNIYCATWNTSDEEQEMYLDKIMKHIRMYTPSANIEKIWDTWYATAFQIAE